MKKNTVFFKDLGVMRYKEAWDFQTTLFQQTVDLKLANRKRTDGLQDPTTSYFFLVEHPPVFTLGKSGKASHLLVSAEQLAREGIDYFPVNRGGDITYHGPGQIVGYPILDLDLWFTDIHKYLRYLEEVIILTLSHFGLHGERSPGETGVWLDVGTPKARKICAMGVKASRWTTMHGFALNVNTPLDHFKYIVPCGISDKAVTSLHLELGRAVDLEEVKSLLRTHFEEQFNCSLTSFIAP